MTVPSSVPTHCVPHAPLLDATALASGLARVPAWRLEGSHAALTRTFRFGSYHQAIAFVNAVAWIAHIEDHHPDMAVHFDRVVVQWSSHDAGGVTDNDILCAARVDALLAG